MGGKADTENPGPALSANESLCGVGGRNLCRRALGGDPERRTWDKVNFLFGTLPRTEIEMGDPIPKLDTTQRVLDGRAFKTTDLSAQLLN